MNGGPLSRLLAGRRPLILDGAMGTELQARGADTRLPLWSARALIEQPDLVLHIHRDYVAAGADILTTNTFRTTVRTFRRAGIPDRSDELTARAVDLARRAASECRERTVLVAGSIAPLEDCYRPDLVPSAPDLEAEHGEQARRLLDDGADFLLVETMGTIREAVAACAAAAATGLEIVASFLPGPGRTLYGGEPLDEAVRSVLPFAPVMISLNCASPRLLEPAIRIVQSAASVPLAVYGNAGLPEGEHGREFTHDVGPEEYAGFACRWAELGAAMIGGCCGTSPSYVAAVERMVQQRHRDTEGS